MFMNLRVQEFELSRFVITHFHAIVSTSVTGSVKSRRDHMAGKLASNPILLLYRSYSAPSGCVLYLVKIFVFMLYGMRLSFDHLVYFLLPKIVPAIVICAFNGSLYFY